MKNILITLAFILTIGVGVSQAQTATDSWAFGFGLSYPRLYSVNVTSINSNFGAYLSIQRNFSEHVGLRLKGGYSYMEGQWIDASSQLIKGRTNLLTGDLDLLYYFSPCESVSPYLFAGMGGNYKKINNAQTPFPDDNKFGTQLNVGAGGEFKLFPNWSLVTEFGYHVTNNSELDGTIAPTELNGRDSYIVLSAGLNFYFDKGKPSKQCEPCQGMTMEMKDMTDYNKIEDMIVKHIPKEVIKEVIKEVLVDKYIVAISDDRLVLVGVNFAFDKSDLLPESYPVLDKGVKLLNDKPNVNVEIEGYCDYIGSDAYNQTLSVERAQTVKAYLVSKGIAENRLTTVGYGKTNPIADNETEEGRALNRRIVFRIIK
ncbi:MAG: OmpA family protein [Ignavibacteriales bacterium]|nr:OmpA family protein [Ignavibacteriales bacterium]